MKVRVVNLYASSDHPGGQAIDGYLQGDTSRSPADGGTADFSAVAFGQTSDFKQAQTSPGGGLDLYIAGNSDMLASRNINGATTSRITIFTYSIGQPGQAASESFDETPSPTDVRSRTPGAISAAPTGQALIVAVGGPLQLVGSADGFNLGQPGKGCLALQVPDGPTDGHSNTPAGGTLNYVADPGSLNIAFYDGLDTDCSQAPVIAAVPLTVAAGDRAYIAGYGATTASMKLLAIPIPVLPGEARLVPLPAPSTTAPAAVVDACSLLTDDEAATALGATSSGGVADTSAGTCTYTADPATLVIGTQTDMTKDAFELLGSRAAGANRVDGLGDAAFLTTDPNSILVLKGSTLIGISLDHHADAGPDDPAVDAPILKRLAGEAMQHL